METLQLILTVALGFILGVVVLIVGVFLAVRWWVKRKIGSFAEQFAEQMTNIGGHQFDVAFQVPMPPRVHLQKREGLAWRDGESVDAFSHELRDADFEFIGDFVFQEMPKILMCVFLDPTRRFYAVIYDVAIAQEVFVDLHARLSDNRTITVTNVSRGEEIETSPSNTKISLKNASARALIARMNEELANQGVTPATPDGFATEFERAYAVSMDFQMARGGPTLDEIRRGAQLRGESVDEPTLRATLRASRQQYSVMLETFMREKFVESAQMSASEWERVRDNLILVHDNHTPDDVAGKFMQASEPDFYEDDDETDYDELTARIKTTPPREAFATLIADLPPGSQPRKLATLLEPVPTDVYAAPSP